MKPQSTLTLLPERRKNETCSLHLAHPSLTHERTAQLAECCKAVGDPTRLAMLDLLVQQSAPLCVCDLTPHFAQNQPTISHHLRQLREAGLIDTEKRGIWAYYWATDQGRRTLAALQSLT